jgi:hypothetical protein
MEALSLAELKRLAKGRGIKHYYIMRRAQLLQLLAMPELPKSFRYEKMTIRELRDEAKRRGLRGFWRLSREELLGYLYPDSKEHEQNEAHAEKHHEPQGHDAQDVGLEVAEDALKQGA